MLFKKFIVSINIRNKIYELHKYKFFCYNYLTIKNTIFFMYIIKCIVRFYNLTIIKFNLNIITDTALKITVNSI
jgi:hypothetical protein